MPSTSTNTSTDTDNNNTNVHPVEESDSEVKYWREGPDLVIERNNGPGNDVEVEVRKNVFTDCSRFEEAARYVKRCILERLKGHREKLKLKTLNGHGRPDQAST